MVNGFSAIKNTLGNSEHRYTIATSTTDQDTIMAISQNGGPPRDSNEGAHNSTKNVLHYNNFGLNHTCRQKSTDTIMPFEVEICILLIKLACGNFEVSTHSTSALYIADETLNFIGHSAASVAESLLTLFIFLLAVAKLRSEQGNLNVNQLTQICNCNDVAVVPNTNLEYLEDNYSSTEEYLQETARHKESFKKSDGDDEIPAILHHIQPDQWTKQPGTHIQVYTVPRFPENHNPLLPLSLQRKLNEMGPREFLTYVLNELTLEERESLMVDERQRRKTFQVTWPLDGNLSGMKMAQAGFYSVDDYDRVQCVFCRGSLCRWERDDIPMLEHARSFAFCRYVKGLNCGNREYRSDKLSADHLKNISMFSAPEPDRHSRIGTLSVDSSTLGISTTRAAHIEYAPQPSRLRTYNRWSASSSLTKERLCEAGFYFTGFDDQVRCFYCSGGLREWQVTDDPWVEHACWFPDCAFLVQQKGQDFVEKVHANTPSNKKCVRKTVAQKKAEVIEQESRTAQDMMYEVCQNLEYTDDQIEAAINHHGGPFDHIKDLVEVKYQMECGAISALPKADISRNNTKQHPVLAEEDLARALQVDNNPSRPGLILASERRKRFENSCLVCEIKTGRFVPACRISLPCGHLTLCESCNTDEINRTKASPADHSPRCMKCHGQLTGTMKVYFA